MGTNQKLIYQCDACAVFAEEERDVCALALPQYSNLPEDWVQVFNKKEWKLYCPKHQLVLKRTGRCDCSMCVGTGPDGEECAKCGCLQNSHWGGRVVNDLNLPSGKWVNCHSCHQACVFEKLKVETRNLTCTICAQPRDFEMHHENPSGTWHSFVE